MLVYFQTVTSFICGGQYAAIVNNWRIDDTYLTGNAFVDAEHLISDLINNTVGAAGKWPQLLADLLADDCFVSSIRARKISPASGPTAVTLFASGDYVGAYGGDFDAFQTTANVTWATASNGPRFGMSKIPGVSSSALVSNRFQDAYTDVVFILTEQVVAGFGTGTRVWEMVIKYGPGGSPSFDEVIGGFLAPTPGNVKGRRLPV